MFADCEAEARPLPSGYKLTEGAIVNDRERCRPLQIAAASKGLDRLGACTLSPYGSHLRSSYPLSRYSFEAETPHTSLKTELGYHSGNAPISGSNSPHSEEFQNLKSR
jgi:hypothetical protein